VPMFGLTLEATMAHQANLESLCEDRPPSGIEIFRGNAFYGIDQIFKAYAGLPEDYALKAVIPHGVSISEQFVWLEEIFNPLPGIFYYPDHAKGKYQINLAKHKLRKKLYPSASPFVYLTELYKSSPQPERKGTIFFPSHSTDLITAQFSIDALIEKLQKLDEIYQPITICLYWRDYQLGRHLPFQAKGFPVVSAGHINDPLFLSRLYHLLSLHRYAAGNEIGSHLFYAVKSGCSYFLLESGDIKRTAEDSQDIALTVSDFNLAKIQEVEDAFRQALPITTPQQQELVDYYLGSRYFQSPESLRQQLLDLETYYELAQDTQRYFQISSPSIATQLEEIPSETSQEERRFLYHFFAKFWSGQKDIFEIGPFLGGTTRAIALGMQANRQNNGQAKLYTCDRFQGYYPSNLLLETLQSAFDNGLLPESLQETIQKTDGFLDVFEAFHHNQSYASQLVTLNQELPDTAETVDVVSHLFQPPDRQFEVVFVDGCKSWYGTKYFLLKMAPHVQKGSIFLFQDYGWYTCFWLPLILKKLDTYFEPLTHVDNTYGFQLTQDLSVEAIKELSDGLESSDRAWIDLFFAELWMQAHNEMDTRAMTTYTLQHGAALTYLGYLEEAQAKLIALLSQPWAKPLEANILAALQFPTYRPDRQQIPLLSAQDYAQLLRTRASLQDQYFSIHPIQQHMQDLMQANQDLTQTHQNLTKQLDENRLLVKELYAKINSLVDDVKGKQEKLSLLREKLERKSERSERMEQRNHKLKRQLQGHQETAEILQSKMRAMETSKFWKLRNVWMRLRGKRV